MSPNLFPSREQLPGARPEQAPEQASVPEVSREQAPEQKEAQEIQKEQHPAVETDYARATAPQPVQREDVGVSQAAVKPQDLVAIEKVLEEHIDELFFSLPPDSQQAFKEKGEETAQQIQGLLQQTKVRVKQILSLIVSWLSLVPGVNKFFIEQQAEIKTNKLLALRDKQPKS